MRSRKILLTLECGGEMSSLTVAVNLTVDSAVTPPNRVGHNDDCRTVRNVRRCIRRVCIEFVPGGSIQTGGFAALAE